MIRFVAMVLTAGALVGCTPSPDDYGVTQWSSSAEHLSDLRTLMDKHGIAHRAAEPRDGMEGVSYQIRNRDRVESLREKLKHQTALRVNEPGVRDYMINLLSEQNLDYIVMHRADGTWIKWFPESNEQSNYVRDSVILRQFALNAAQSSSECKPFTSAQGCVHR